MNASPVRTDVLVIGAGPAGLTAATELAAGGVGEVLVLDREGEPGGVPRHCHHTGFGLRDLRRCLTGPGYAARLAERAAAAGVTVRTRATVTGWAGDDLLVTSPQGRQLVQARAVVLATGARERPRSARLIPGDRPQGVLTTGHLQNLVHLGLPVGGRRAVVVGAEAVSWSAVLTLRAAGVDPILLTTPLPRPSLALLGRTVLGVPVATRTRVAGILGHGRVSAVELEQLDTGARRRLACDTVVLTGDWIPEHELARSGGLTLDPGTRGPLVDTALRTSRPGVFAAGNLVHPVDTADVAALGGRHVANAVRGWLAGHEQDGQDGQGRAVRLLADAPLRWVAPGLMRLREPPARRRLLLWTDQERRRPRVTAVQDGRVLGRHNGLLPAAVGRVLAVPFTVVGTPSPDRGPVRLHLD